MEDREQTLADYLAGEIQKDIDFNILRGLLVKQGWFSVKASRKYSGAEIEEWAKIQCIGKFHYLSEQWLFSNKKDAIIFILKWTK